MIGAEKCSRESSKFVKCACVHKPFLFLGAMPSENVFQRFLA